MSTDFKTSTFSIVSSGDSPFSSRLRLVFVTAGLESRSNVSACSRNRAGFVRNSTHADVSRTIAAGLVSPLTASVDQSLPSIRLAAKKTHAVVQPLIVLEGLAKDLIRSSTQRRSCG